MDGTDDRADEDLMDIQQWDAADRAAALKFPDDHPELMFTGADMVRARAEGRREANNALDWQTSCLGCAARLDSLIAERNAGADDAVRRIVAALYAAHAATGERGLLAAVAVALSHASNPAQIDAEPSGSPVGGSLLPDAPPA